MSSKISHQVWLQELFVSLFSLDLSSFVVQTLLISLLFWTGLLGWWGLPSGAVLFAGERTGGGPTVASSANFSKRNPYKPVSSKNV